MHTHIDTHKQTDTQAHTQTHTHIYTNTSSYTYNFPYFYCLVADWINENQVLKENVCKFLHLKLVAYCST